MNRFFATLFFAIITIYGNAQVEKDNVLSVHYIAHFKLFAEAKGEITEERVLDIDSITSCFYGRWQRKREEIADSISTIGGSRDNLLLSIKDYPTPRQFYTIYNNYPSVGKRTVTDQLLKRFYYEEEVDPIEWTLLDRDTTILDYPCQMAVCKYRNHKWTVCYTQEIPIALGPWKLQGLPGLILTASDDSKVFSFECIEIRKGTKKMPIPNLSRYIKCTREEIKNMQRDAYKSPEDFAKRFGAVGKGTYANGKPIIYKERTALFMD